MGYAVILILVFYTGVAFLRWISGILIPDTSSIRVQADILVLILSGVITAAIAIYGRRELIRSKDKMSDGGLPLGRLIRWVGVLGLIIFSLGAISRVVLWVSKNAPSLPTKASAATPQKETREEVKA
jgi:hypothetical protein